MSIAYLDPGNIESDLQAGAVAEYRVSFTCIYSIPALRLILLLCGKFLCGKFLCPQHPPQETGSRQSVNRTSLIKTMYICVLNSHCYANSITQYMVNSSVHDILIEDISGDTEQSVN